MNANVNKPPSEMRDRELQLEIAELLGWRKYDYMECPSVQDQKLVGLAHPPRCNFHVHWHDDLGCRRDYLLNWPTDDAAALGLLDELDVPYNLVKYKVNHQGPWKYEVDIIESKGPTMVVRNTLSRAISEAFVLARRAA